MILQSCSGNSDGPAAPPAPRATLVYMVASNSLGAAHFDTADIEEMKTAAAQGDFNGSRLFIYHHPHNGTPVLKEITSEGERIITEYSIDEPSVSSTRMNRVIADFRHEADALSHGLILWSHGSGWIENGMEPAANHHTQEPEAISPQSFGDDRGRYMNVTTLAKVLYGKGFDYIYFDCCYMAGVEVAYELRNCTRHIVASSTELPADGMPYDRTLRHLLKKDADLIAAARTTFDSYDSQQGMNRTCTISVIDTSALDDLAEATRDIYAANNTTSPSFSPQHFMTSSCYIFDFGQYVDELAANHPGLKTRFDDILAATVVFKAATPSIWDSFPIDHHSGLSTYLPDFANTPRFNYDNLQWAADVASAL